MSGVVVVDTSIAAKWVLPEHLHLEARELLRAWEAGGVTRLAPSIFLSEINTPFLRLRRLGRMSDAEARQARAEVLSAMSIEPDLAGLTARAFDIADALGLRRAHDSLYAALAEREGCEFWTADSRFANDAGRWFPWVHNLGEVPPRAESR